MRKITAGLLYLCAFVLHAEDTSTPYFFYGGQSSRFMSMGAAPLQPGNLGFTSLMQAAMNGNLEQAKSALKDGEDVNSKSETEDTALLLSINYNHTDIAKFLLNNNANPNLTGRLGESPLMLAAENRNAEIIKLLLKKGADPRYRPYDSTGNSALDMAVMHAGLNIVKLIAAHLDVKTDMTSALIKSTWKGYIVDVDYLLKLGVDPNKDNPLMAAIKSGHNDIVELLIKHGADTNQKGEKDKYPIFAAVEKGDAKITETLLKNKTNTSLVNWRGDSLMDIAESRENDEIIKLLKKYKAPYSTKNLQRFIYKRLIQFKKYGDFKDKKKFIITTFGTPIKIIKEKDKIDDRDPTVIYKIEKWIYDGMELTHSTYGSRQSETSFGCTLLKSPKYKLINGLKIGDNKELFIKSLGTPIKFAKDHMEYKIRFSTDDDEHDFKVELHYDANGSVDSIIWK